MDYSNQGQPGLLQAGYVGGLRETLPQTAATKPGVMDAIGILSKEIQQAHGLMERLESRLAAVCPPINESDSYPKPSNRFSSPVGSQIETAIEGVTALQNRINKILNLIEL